MSTLSLSLLLPKAMISGKVRGQGGKPWENYFESMYNYLDRLHMRTAIADLSVIHVAGTKGKGSTSAMTESILRHCGYRTGLYTSPHLVDVRERIKLDGRPVALRTFLDHLWWCHERLEGSATDEVGMPAYFRFLTLLGLRIFLHEKPDVAVLEVGMGGRLDATNVVPHPDVCAITPIGFDHMEVLGDTLDKIAREKAGILKDRCLAFTSPQEPEALAAIQEMAARVNADLRTPRPLSEFQTEPGAEPLTVAQRGQHMEENAALAVALASAWERRRRAGDARVRERLGMLDRGVLPREYVRGMNGTEWPGRSHIVQDRATSGQDATTSADPSLTFFLDGAHTPESMKVCADWFAAASQRAATSAAPSSSAPHETERVLLFNCMPERSPKVLLSALRAQLAARGVALDGAVFVPGESSTKRLGGAGSPRGVDLSWQTGMQKTWSSEILHPTAVSSSPRMSATPFPPTPELGQQAVARGAVAPSLQSAIDWLRRSARDRPRVRLHVLVTGSLYLVGDVLRLTGEGPAAEFAKEAAARKGGC